MFHKERSDPLCIGESLGSTTCRSRVGSAQITKLQTFGDSDLTNFPTNGNYGPCLGLDPDDSPLLLKDMGTQDIYALDWKVP